MAATHFSGPVYSKGGFVGQIDPTNGNVLTAPLFVRPTPNTVATAGNVTYTAAQVLNGLMLRDAAGAARTDVLPTAALIVAALNGTAVYSAVAYVGQTVAFTIFNTAAGAFTVQVTMGTGGTSATANVLSTIAQSATKTFHIQLTNVTPGSEAYTVYA